MAGGALRGGVHGLAGPGNALGQKFTAVEEDHRRVGAEMSQELQTAVVGVNGYAGQELTRILYQHPRLNPPVLLAREGDEAREVSPPVDGSPVKVHPFSW